VSAVAITVPHGLPAPAIEVVPLAVVQRHEALLASAASLPAITTPEIADQANRLLLDLAEVEKAIELAVESKSKPVHALHKAIVAVGKKASEPVATAKAGLRTKVGAWNREQERIRQEAIAKAEAERRAAVEAAEAERRRLQAEADARATEAKAKAEAEAAELAAFLGKPAAEVPVEVPAAPPVAVAVPPPAAPATVIPPPVKSVVATRQVPVLEITDATLVPAYVAGVEVRPIDRAAVRRLMDKGIEIAGARIVMREQDVMRGGR